jgi:FdhE protein
VPVAPPAPGLADHARQQAEWRSWLAVLDAVHAAAREPAWGDALPALPPGAGAPLLADTTLTVDARLLRRWLRELVRIAAAGGSPASTLVTLARADVERHAEVLEAGLRQDSERLAALASGLGADAGALSAIAAVAPVPLLRACATRWADRVPADWDHGACPVCGAWPMLAEARGLERTRSLRCGRCAADWRTQWLRCPYCATADHTRLGSLVLTRDAGADTGAGLARVATSIETCRACQGYVKTVTTLAPIAADELLLIDLATVELDVAAIEHGYTRPSGPGHAVSTRVAVSERRGLAGWLWT